MTHIILINLRLVFVFQRSLVRERRVGDIFIKSWDGNLFIWDSDFPFKRLKSGLLGTFI